MMNELDKNLLFNKHLSEFQINPEPIRNIYDNAIKYSYHDTPIQVGEGKIKRIMVNQIRHSCTNYDDELRKIRPLTRMDDTYYYIYKNYTLCKIQEQYEYLYDECERQKTNVIMARRV